MKTDPVFCGKVHVTVVKNENWFWHDYKTSKKNDKKIVELAKSFLPDACYVAGHNLSKKEGNAFRDVIEKSVGEKLDIPKNPIYTVKYLKSYNPLKKKNFHFIRLFCMEKLNMENMLSPDRTAIDIRI